MSAPATEARGTAGSANSLWSRDLILCLLSTLSYWIGFYLLLSTLPLHIVDDLRGTQSQVGLLAALLNAASITARPIAGYALDRWGRRAIHLGALLLFSLLALAYALPRSLWALLAVRALHGIPFGVVTNATLTVASDLVPERRRGEGMGLAALSPTVAMAIAPTLGLSLMAARGFAHVALGAGAMGALALLLASVIHHRPVHNARVRLSWSVLVERRVGWLALTMMFIVVGYGGIMSFVTLYAEELGIAHAGWFFSVYALGLMLTRVPAGRAFDRLGPRLTVGGGLAALMAAYLMLGLWRAETGFLGAAFVLGMGIGSVASSMQAMVVNAVPVQRRGAAIATYFSAADLGIGGGSYLLGVVAEVAGSYGVVYLAAAGLLLIPTVMFFGRVVPRYEMLGQRR